MRSQHAYPETNIGLPGAYRLGPSSSQNTAYRRLALAVLGLDVATLADRLRSDRIAASRPLVSGPVAIGGVPRLPSMVAVASRSA